ncbi:MAG: hypothetical protein EXX96DRAFT_547414 [Benjaminiella poitrasii]|nr:MAG: hypothetical protein EXX96DRAFT_547414 [Benjaminiella poitrasii]
MTANNETKSKRLVNVIEPNTQVSSRSEIFEQNVIDEDAVKEDSQRMDMLMRSLMGIEEDDNEANKMNEDQNDEVEKEEEFAFRLFASQPVATVTIAEKEDNTDDLSKAIAEQQVYEFDDTDPEFLSRVEQAAVDYDTILTQSKVPYPTAVQSHRVIHISSIEKQTAEEKNKKRKRKSKKCRDFEKAVKEGKIKVEPNMRDPRSPGGWPGWPGQLTRVAIINYQSPKKKGISNFKQGGRGGRGGVGGRGGFRGGSSTNRGGHGGPIMSRGRGRGRGRPY